MKPTSPCYGCEGRFVGCRTNCDKWAAFEEAKQERYARQRAAAAAEPGKPEFAQNIRRKLIQKARYNQK